METVLKFFLDPSSVAVAIFPPQVNIFARVSRMLKVYHFGKSKTKTRKCVYKHFMHKNRMRNRVLFMRFHNLFPKVRSCF